MVVTALFLSGTAEAQYPYEPYRSPAGPVRAEPPYWQVAPPEKDPKYPAAIAMAVTGGLSVATGIGLTAAGANVRSQCSPLTGACFTVTDQDMITGGIGFLAGGASLGAMGLALAHLSAANHPYPYRSAGMMNSGMVLTGLGASTVIGGAAVWLRSAYDYEEGTTVGTGMFLAGAGLLAIGVPVWIVGSRPPEAPDGAVEAIAASTPSGEYVDRSPTLAFVGGTMVATGSLTMVTALGVGIDIENAGFSTTPRTGVSRNGGGIWTSMIVGVAGAGMIAFGLPVLVKGARDVPPIEAHANIKPELLVGPSGVVLRSEF